MTSFVLVHGGWHGAWCWERVVPLLTAAGHHAATPTLTGLGDRAAEATPDLSVGTHAADIEQAVRGIRGPVVLVAHSYSGAPVEMAAPRLADRLIRIVHIDSFCLDDGEAMTPATT
jgi:pimeloyl-ACP methyl ester carboxylesterase